MQLLINMEHVSKKTPQNISDSLKEIGELSCVLYLDYYFNDKGWSVYRNYDEKGYDILLFNHATGKKVKIRLTEGNIVEGEIVE